MPQSTEREPPARATRTEAGCASGDSVRDRLGLSFTINYLLFNKGSSSSTEAEPPVPATTQRGPGSLNCKQNQSQILCRLERERVKLDPESPETGSWVGGLGGSEEEEENEIMEEEEREKDGQGSKAEGVSSSSETPPDKPTQSYIALISMAILASQDQKLLLCDIYQWIMDHYPYFQSKDKNWRNSVRHNLSLNECFVKAGRSDNGKGHYWAIHPANMHDFARGDYHRRRARRRIRRIAGQLPCPLPPSYPPYQVGSAPYWCCPPPHLPYLPARLYWGWAALPAHRAVSLPLPSPLPLSVPLPLSLQSLI